MQALDDVSVFHQHIVENYKDKMGLREGDTTGYGEFVIYLTRLYHIPRRVHHKFIFELCDAGLIEKVDKKTIKFKKY